MDMDGDSYDLIYDALKKLNNGGDDKTVAVLLYVYQPWCPYCKEFMPKWNDEVEMIQNLMQGIQSYKIQADNINGDDKLIPPKNTVPQVLLFTYNPELGSSVSEDLSQPPIRENLRENVEKSLEKSKIKIKKRNQSGKGVVESIVAASILGGVAISSTKSPEVSTILKQAVKGIETITNQAKISIEKISGKKPSKNIVKTSISSATKAINAQKYADATTNAIKGLSETTADILQGKIKKLSQKNLMNIYKTLKSNKSKKNSRTRSQTRKLKNKK
jgi:thiol-disulfide isomerase/thioredoxin